MKTAVIGTTTWGTTLAIILARRGLPVTIWARTAEEALRLSKDRQNKVRLPDHDFPPPLPSPPPWQRPFAMPMPASSPSPLPGCGRMPRGWRRT